MSLKSQSLPRVVSMLGLALACACTPVPDDDDDEGYAGDYDDDEGGSGGGSGEDGTIDYDGSVIRLGSFNIEWLRDYYKYRSTTDYDMVAQLLNELSPTVMGLQEIDGDGAMELLQEHGLDSRYAWRTGSEGDVLRTVIMYDTETVSLSNGRMVDISPTGFRDLNVAEITVDETGESFVFGVVHLASEYDSSNTTTRRDEVLALHDWINNDMEGQYGDAAQRMAIVGDFNDTFAGIDDDIDTLQPLEDDDDLVFTTENTVTYTNINQRSKIDHILLDGDLADRWLGQYDDENGCIVFPHDGTAPYSNYEGGYEDTQNISDHRSLYVELAVEDF